MAAVRVPFPAMGCACEVVLDLPEDESARAAAQDGARAALAEVARIEAKYSRYRADSIVSRINAGAGGAPIECDAETLALLDHADALHRTSGGLFDITSGVLRRGWDFKAARRPEPAQLDALLALVGWTRVQRHGAAVRLPAAGMELDFGGFGKEYAADRAAAVLVQHGATNGYVNLAGDMRVIGPRRDGSPWRIGIAHPRRPGELVATIPVAQGGLATSGDYERYFELDGRRYCHILDPRTGQPVTHWQSVSVLAPLAVVAGSCCTIAMLEQDDALAFLRDSGMDYLAVDAHGRIHLRADEAG